MTRRAATGSNDRYSRRSSVRLPLAGALLLTLALSMSGQTPSFDWAAQMTGGSLEVGLDLAVDSTGNVYTTGSFRATTDFDPGPGVFNLSALGNSSVFVSKLDSSGNFVWAKRLGGPSDSHGHAIAVDAVGNVCVAGQFSGIADFDPGPGVFNMYSLYGPGMFVVKLDSNGNLVWAKSAAGTFGYPRVDTFDIEVDITGNVYTTGSFEESVDFDPGSGVFALTASGRDVFVLKLNASGNFAWASALIGSGSAEGYGVSVDGAGNVYTAGRFSGQTDFDPGTGTFNLVASGSTDAFVVKLDSAGQFVWAGGMGGNVIWSPGDHATGIAVDPSGNVHIVGVFWGTADFDPGAGTFTLTSLGQEDVFVSKLDIAGNFAWAGQISSVMYDEAHGIAIDPSGAVHTSGRAGSGADFDPGPGVFTVPTTGACDICMQMGQRRPVRLGWRYGRPRFRGNLGHRCRHRRQRAHDRQFRRDGRFRPRSWSVQPHRHRLESRHVRLEARASRVHPHRADFGRRCG